MEASCSAESGCGSNARRKLEKEPRRKMKDLRVTGMVEAYTLRGV